MQILEAAGEQQWFDRVATDPEFGHVSRWTRLTFTLVNGADARSYRIDAGRLTVLETRGNAAEASTDVVLAGAPQAWADFLAPVPPPHSNHVLAMDRRRPDFEIRAGRDQLIRHLRVLDLVLQAMRSPEGMEASR